MLKISICLIITLNAIVLTNAFLDALTSLGGLGDLEEAVPISGAIKKASALKGLRLSELQKKIPLKAALSSDTLKKLPLDQLGLDSDELDLEKKVGDKLKIIDDKIGGNEEEEETEEDVETITTRRPKKKSKSAKKADD